MTRTGDGEAGLGETYLRLARRLRAGWGSRLEEYGLSPHQARALRVIDDATSPRLREVADRLGVAPRSVTDVVDALEAKGLVAREADPADRRAVCVRLTPQGEALRERMRGRRRLELDAWFEPLSAPERAELRRLLAKLDAATRD